jgi:hypothetical protein
VPRARMNWAKLSRLAAPARRAAAPAQQELVR